MQLTNPTSTNDGSAASNGSIVKGLVSVVIPNWNGKKFLKGCLDSLIQSSYGQIEIVIIDNGSHDGSVEFLEENYPQVKLIKFAQNTGFSVAVNAGITNSTGEFVALLNNDTTVDPLWITNMVAAMREHPEIGSTGCKMLAYDNHKLLDGAGDGYRRGGLPGRIGHREIDLGQFDQERYILGPCGGAALYRRSMLDDIGLFDSDYFAYLEDVDIGLRAQSAGYKCLYVPSAIMYHLGCGTTGSGYHPLVVRLSSQNNWNTIVKNIPLPLLLKFMPQIIYWQAFYFAVVIVRGGQVIPWLEGTGRALLLLPKMLKKRADINKRRKVSLSYLEEVIVRSEEELAESRKRLVEQSQATETK
ncbi:MAG: glycosyltransferase family 2 protein [Candidatus Obscuribacterales bacterium]|nr:glycosyltransferase family 2 protein [Candidatus Obscuribacterales bacterium]